MIAINAVTACVLYLGVTLAILLALWVSQHLKSRRRRVRAVFQELATCEYCQTAYLMEVGRPLSRCPSCHSFNRSHSR